MKKIKILIADDHKIVIDGLISLISNEPDIEIAGLAKNKSEVINLLNEKKIDVIILDIHLEHSTDGLEITHLIKEKYPDTQVLILSFHKEDRIINKLVSAGASGYIIKEKGSDELVEGIRKVANGEKYFDKEVFSKIINSIQNKSYNPNSDIQLTRREEEVLREIANGLTAKQIGNKLFIAESTVETHRKNLLEKLNLPNSKQLMLWAIEKGYSSKL